MACGGGSSSSKNTVTDPPVAPQDGIRGVVASNISGAQLTVQDASGEEIVIASGRTTGADGSFALVFSEFAINAGIKAPLIISLNGSGATALCDFNREGDNDCLANDGSFAAFGETYTLADDYSLQGLAESFPPDTTEGDRVITVNLSAASDLAGHYATDAAAGNDLLPADVTLASQQALGVVEFVTGLSTHGKALNDIAISDLTDSEPPVTESLALALFGAGLHGQVNADVNNVNSYNKVLNRLGLNVVPVSGSTTNQLRATGQFLAETVTAYVTGATSYQAGLETNSAVLAGSISAQTTAIPLLEQVGGNPVFISLPADPASNDPIDRAKTLTTALSEVMGATLLISQTAGFGGTADGAALVFTEQLAMISTLVSQELRRTLLQLDNAIAEALANGETILTGTNVSGVLSFEGDVVTMTTTTSTSSNIQTGISVNLTIPTGTRNNPGGDGVFDAHEITISVSETQNDLTTQQLFEGKLVLSMQAAAVGADVSSLDYSGGLRTNSGLEFTGDIEIDNLSTKDETSLRGSYDTAFTFVDSSMLMMDGLLETQINLYTLNAGNSTVITDLQTNVITDMNADLNLSINGSGAVSGGVIVATEVQAGTLDTRGIINFTDGTATILPVPVI